MNFDPHIPPVESSTLSPESLQFCSDLAERISITLRSLATGLRNGQVGLGDAVADLQALIREDLLSLRVVSIAILLDGKDQLRTQHAVIRHAAGGR